MNRGMRITTDDDRAGRAQTRFHDGVMDAAATAIKQVANLVASREPAHGGQRLCSLPGSGREVVIKGEDDPGGILDRRALHFIFENLDDKAGAEVVHDHQVDRGHYHFTGLYPSLAALQSENLLDHVHSSCRLPRL